MGVAFRHLRKFTREGRREELDLEETIQATARNAGELEFIFRPERRNNVQLLLLMDVGGSMTPYTRLSERLFSAAHAASHFKTFRPYYFHNCPYETLFRDMARRDGEPTEKVLSQVDDDWFCIIVGDAAMSPYELTSIGGSVDYFHHNEEPGLTWLRKILDRVPNTVWLNPEPRSYWDHTMSNQFIRRLFDMYPLSLEGLASSIDALRRGTGRFKTTSTASAR